jgi:hypothetical protein
MLLQRMGLLTIATVVVFGAAGASRSDAAIIPFTSRNAFNAALAATPGIATQVETFDTVPAQTVIPNGSTFDGVRYQSSAGNLITTADFLPLSPPNTLGADRRPFFDFFLPGDLVILTFPQPILAFGVSFSTNNTTPASYTVNTNLGGVIPSGFDPFPGASTGQFAGFITDTPVTSVTITSNPLSSDGFTLDNVTSATPAGIPEPGSLALLGTGTLALLGYGWARRKLSRRPATRP